MKILVFINVQYLICQLDDKHKYKYVNISNFIK